jgi:hypothetical protein
MNLQFVTISLYDCGLPFYYFSWASCCYAQPVTVKWGKKKGLHLKFLLFSDIYTIQIVQNIAQLSSKERFT